MRRALMLLVLEAYAFVLAWMQSLGGVRTDEAKYLLDIPYPHPPLVRWILSQTELWSFQELFWRVVFASLMVQAVWLIWAMGKGLARREQIVLCGLWLCAGSIVLQGGSIMMVVLTALQGLVFALLWMRKDLTPHPALVLLFWLISLFTAYQAALFFPFVLVLLHRSRLSWITSFILMSVPAGLLVLYTLSNPLSLASLVNAGTNNVSLSHREVLRDFLTAWAIGGSIVLLFAGTVGMVKGRAWFLVSMFALVSVYNYASVHTYYAILFTPFLIAGCVYFLRAWPMLSWPLLLCTILGTAFLWSPFHPTFEPSAARAKIAELHLLPDKGPLLIQGSFGHEWQYESPVPVRKYTATGASAAQTVTCGISPC